MLLSNIFPSYHYTIFCLSQSFGILSNSQAKLHITYIFLLLPHLCILEVVEFCFLIQIDWFSSHVLSYLNFLPIRVCLGHSLIYLCLSPFPYKRLSHFLSIHALLTSFFPQSHHHLTTNLNHLIFSIWHTDFVVSLSFYF